MTEPPAGAAAASERAVAAYTAAFGELPSHLVRSPGRVNLIGEHTDYNGGRCLPVAIDLELCLAFGDERGTAASVEIVSEGEPERAVVALPPPAPPPAGLARPAAGAQPGWAGYVEGVVVMAAAQGDALRGWRGAVASDLPIGAGLSSSAALELAVARACSCSCASAWLPAGSAPGPAAGWDSVPDWDPACAARLAQRAENNWVGIPTGLLDQLACACGVAGHALLVDFADPGYPQVSPVPLPAGAAVAVVDTGTRRTLATSAYAQRRAECERAASDLGVASLGVATLRDLGGWLPADAAARLDPVAFRRARHVVSENQRVGDVADALRRGDLVRAGETLVEGHRSLRDDFKVSGPELDAAVAACLKAKGCYGARMTGGGFAGCAVALVDRAAAASFEEDVVDRYRQTTGLTARVHVCTVVAGTSVVPVPPVPAS